MAEDKTDGQDVLRLHWLWYEQFFKTRKAAQKAADAANAEAKPLTPAQQSKIVAAAKKRWAAKRKSKARHVGVPA